MYLLEQYSYDFISDKQYSEIILISESERLCKKIAEQRFWKHADTNCLGENCVIDYYIHEYESEVLFGKIKTLRMIVDSIKYKCISWETFKLEDIINE